jgi:multidrug resistance efflux pump
MPTPTTPPLPDSLRLQEREEIQYLLGNAPGWMMRFGITAVAGLLALLLWLSYVLRYPDVVEAGVVLTMHRPPIRVMAAAGGRIAELHTSEGATVEAGAVLTVLENTAHLPDVQQLEAWLAAPTETLPTGLRLGELQQACSALAQHWQDLRYFRRHHGVEEQATHLRGQITQLRAVNENLSRQKDIMRRELALAEQEYRRQQQLHAGGVISDKEWHSSEAAYLAQERQVESAEAAILQNEMQIRQLESQVSELYRIKSERENEKSLTVSEDLQRTHSAIAEWKLRYLVTAPVSGQVSLYKVWSAQQSVAPGEEVLAISPASLERVIGRAELPALQSGRVAVGQRASIRLDGYPAEQFGEIEASVVSVALLPRSDAYLVELSLPDTLRSTYGKLLPFKPEMSGAARIVTEERRVLDRMLGHMRDLLKL